MPDELNMPDVLVVNGIRYVRAEGQTSDLLTVAQICELAHMDVHTVYNAMNDGRLPYSVPNGCKRPRRARRADVMAWMQGRSAAGMG